MHRYVSVHTFLNLRNNINLVNKFKAKDSSEKLQTNVEKIID